jgi:hypothetical protein
MGNTGLIITNDSFYHKGNVLLFDSYIILMLLLIIFLVRIFFIIVDIIVFVFR